MQHDWVGVPESEYGEQLWDRKSIKKRKTEVEYSIKSEVEAKNNAEENLAEAIKILKEDIQLGDIGSTIQKHVEANGFSVVQDFCGHGIGQKIQKVSNKIHQLTIRGGANFLVC